MLAITSGGIDQPFIVAPTRGSVPGYSGARRARRYDPQPETSRAGEPEPGRSSRAGIGRGYAKEARRPWLERELALERLAGQAPAQGSMTRGSPPDRHRARCCRRMHRPGIEAVRPPEGRSRGGVDASAGRVARVEAGWPYVRGPVSADRARRTRTPPSSFVWPRYGSSTTLFASHPASDWAIGSSNWLGSRDSNPNTVVQSHVSCRWTTPHQSRDRHSSPAAGGVNCGAPLPAPSPGSRQCTVAATPRSTSLSLIASRRRGPTGPIPSDGYPRARV